MRLSRKAFDQLVDAAIASLPPQYAQWLDQVPLIVEDRPAPSDLPPDRPDDEPLGIYHGTAQLDPTASLPAHIFLYRIPLMEACSSREQLADEIRKTILHELGHHAGLDEPALDQHGLGPLHDDDISWDLDEAP